MCVEGTDWLDDWRENSMKTMRIEMETTENIRMTIENGV